jgi:hypothetical protein
VRGVRLATIVPPFALCPRLHLPRSRNPLTALCGARTRFRRGRQRYSKTWATPSLFAIACLPSFASLSSSCHRSLLVFAVQYVGYASGVVVNVNINVTSSRTTTLFEKEERPDQKLRNHSPARVSMLLMHLFPLIRLEAQRALCSDCKSNNSEIPSRYASVVLPFMSLPGPLSWTDVRSANVPCTCHILGG